MRTYREILTADAALAFAQSSRRFERRGDAHKTLQRIASDPKRREVDSAVVSASAVYSPRRRRFFESAETIDLLVTPNGREMDQPQIATGSGSAYTVIPNAVRDAETGVDVNLCGAGETAGFRRLGSVTFPHLADASIEMDGLQFLATPKLVKLNLAVANDSATSALAKIRHERFDVQEMTKQACLSKYQHDGLHADRCAEHPQLE